MLETQKLRLSSRTALLLQYLGAAAEACSWAVSASGLPATTALGGAPFGGGGVATGTADADGGDDDLRLDDRRLSLLRSPLFLPLPPPLPLPLVLVLLLGLSPRLLSSPSSLPPPPLFSAPPGERGATEVDGSEDRRRGKGGAGDSPPPETGCGLSATTPAD